MKKEPQVFKVMARNMYCGMLTVTTSGRHIFRSRDGMLTDPEKINHYTGLNLVRVK